MIQTSRISRVVLVEIGERDARELVHAEAAEQSRILFEDADHFVGLAVQPHGLAERVGMREQRVGDGVADHHDAARVLLVALRDVAARAPRVNSGSAAAYSGCVPRMIIRSTCSLPYVMESGASRRS